MPRLLRFLTLSPIASLTLGFVSLALVACGVTPARSAAPKIPVTDGATLASTPDQFFTSGDIRTRYRVIGRAAPGRDPVVLLHGFTRDLTDWYGLGDSLARHHRVIALDWRGSGKSSKPADPARYGSEMFDDVARLMDHLVIARAHVIGHSMGATGASGFAVRYPTRVNSVVLIAGLFEDSVAFARRFVSPIAELERSPNLTAEDRGALVAVLRNVPPAILPGQTGAVKVPALAVVGTEDSNLPSTQALASAWPELRVLILPGADHGGVLARPELLTAIRAQFDAR